MKNTIYRINAGFVTQQLDGKLVMFDANNSTLYTFNETAELIFKKIKLGWDEERIILFLEKQYDSKSPTFKKDVKELMKTLLKNGIIIKK